MSQLPELIKSDALVHLDSGNKAVKLHPNAMGFRTKPVVSANAYLGARGIVKALDHGADIVICGRVADASPVIAAAQWWWGWKESQYDELAGESCRPTGSLWRIVVGLTTYLLYRGVAGGASYRVFCVFDGREFRRI